MSSLMRPLLLSRLCALTALLVSASSASASSMNYGDFDDIPPGVVMYQDVTESNSGPGLLYGAPTASGNSLVFNPAAYPFEAEAAGNGPPKAIDGALSFTLEMVPTTSLTALSISEAGDYLFSGAGGAGTSIAADLVGTITILEINHSPVVPIVGVFSAAAPFSTDLPTEGVGAGTWSSQAVINFGAYADLMGGGVTKAVIAINNVLSADAEMDSLARIRKKAFVVTPSGDLDDDRVIPEPASAVLGLLGLVAVAAGRRRS